MGLIAWIRSKVLLGATTNGKNATGNLEHIIVIEGKTVAKMFRDSFDKIYNNPHYYSYFYGVREMG